MEPFPKLLGVIASERVGLDRQSKLGQRSKKVHKRLISENMVGTNVPALNLQEIGWLRGDHEEQSPRRGKKPPEISCRSRFKTVLVIAIADKKLTHVVRITIDGSSQIAWKRPKVTPTRDNS